MCFHNLKKSIRSLSIFFQLLDEFYTAVVKSTVSVHRLYSNPGSVTYQLYDLGLVT